MTLYSKNEVVDVVDAEGNAIPGLPTAPKSWLDTDLVPAGTKKGKPKADDAATVSTAAARPAREPGTEPAGNASRDEWAAYAAEKGAKPEDLLDDVGEELNRDALKDKFGSKS